MEPVNIRIPKTKIQKIDEIATRNGITRSEVIRHALTIYFQLLEKELKIGKSMKNDLIAAIGEPKVRDEVLNAGTRSIVMVEGVRKLSEREFIHESFFFLELWKGKLSCLP